MEVAVLIPGIMGTRLFLPGASGASPEEVWPPTPLETQFGYNRIEKLLDPGLVPGAAIDKVLCFSFYKTINDQLLELGYKDGGNQKRRVEFPYDWRRDNFDTAAKLAARLDRLHDEGATRITLIGHSMGGLICRLLLESGTYDARPWFASIAEFIALATPHLGAPLALARIFGIDSTLGIRASDFARLAANRAYPSGYQLIPAPGENAIWNQASADVAALDPYDEATAKRLKLDHTLVLRAKAMHDAFAAGRRPSHVRYFYFAGAGHRTVTRVNVVADDGHDVDHGMSIATRTPDAGDGTVPLYSALPTVGQRQIVVNEHATVFDGKIFRAVFFPLLGGSAGPFLEGPEKLRLSVDSPVQITKRRVELTLSVASASADSDERPRTEAIDGKLMLEALDEKGVVLADPPVRTIPIVYHGPSVGSLTVELPAIERPGLYRARFEGTPSGENEAPFAVSAA